MAGTTVINGPSGDPTTLANVPVLGWAALPPGSGAYLRVISKDATTATVLRYTTVNQSGEAFIVLPLNTSCVPCNPPKITLDFTPAP